ncbi:sensor histidine kinase [Pseudomonas citronellolis]|uniref:sensor histidine kinase n=1 Tax=Pseudomonas citronellolis TaxID=53408 RepID=UPI0023E44705|nr:ATP-binding protein [Pseudomonas citronellolis]MDF3933339.1 ATP-binding protein [Pseudomonas citronellolis]
MFSVRLSEIPRTTSFRVALLFLLLFSVASLALFGYIYWRTAGYLRAEVQGNLTRQIHNRAELEIPALIREVQEHAAKDPEQHFPQALFDASGRRLAGTLAELPSSTRLERPIEFKRRNLAGSERRVRGIVHRMPSGELLVVGQDIQDLLEFDELLVNAMASGGVLILVLGLAGALVAGRASQRRLDAVTGAIERIVKGDLSERLPVRGSSDDVDRLAAVVNRMLDEIERLMHEVKGVCDDVAHDLRTPLTRLLAGLERAQRRDGDKAEFAAAVDQAIEDAHGLLLTFRALLRISEIEDSARRTGFVAVDLARVAADVVELFEPLAEERGLHLNFRGPAQAAWLQGDAHLLFDALSNLVDNALKFTPAGGRVEVRVEAGEGGVEAQVRDDGPGIPEEEREAVLRRFYRSERSRHTPGNGLGLSMVAAVARLHDLAMSVGDGAPGCWVSLRGRAVVPKG